MGRVRRLLVLLTTAALLVAGMALAPSALAATPGQLSASVIPDNGKALVSVYPAADEFGNPLPDATYQASVDDGQWRPLTVTPNDVTGQLDGTIANLTNGTTYRIRARAVDSGDEGPASEPVQVTPGRPTAPSLNPVVPGDTIATVTFSPPTATGGFDVSGYQISVRPDPTSRAWVDAQEQDVDGVLTRTLTGLTNGVTRYIAVRALNSNGYGRSSDSSAVTPGRPTAPSLYQVTGTDRGASIAFTPPSSSGGFDITGYDVSAVPADEDPAVRRWDQFVPPSDVTENPDGSGTSLLAASGLLNGTPYNIALRARNDDGPGPGSDPQSVTPDAQPGPPTDVVATITPSNAPSVRGQGTATVTFTPPVGGGGQNSSDIQSYTATSNPAGGNSDCSSLTSCVITGLTNGTSYTFTVTATNSTFLNSDPSAASNTVVPSGAPYPPRSLARAGAGPNSATVSFLPPYFSGRGVTGYQVSSDNGKTWRAVPVRASGSRRLVTATGLRPGVRYTIRVRAVNALGTGAYSAGVVSLTGPSIVPGRPAARAGTSAALVRWTASRESDVFGYYVVSSRGARCYTYTRTETSCIVGNTAGASTTYRVYARSTSGSSYASTASNTVRASSPYVPSQLPGVPGGFRAVSKKVKTGKNATLIARGFLPSSSVVLVAYGAKRHIVKRFTANAAGNFAAVVTMPKDPARSLTFVAFGVTPYASTKAIAASIRRG